MMKSQTGGNAQKSQTLVPAVLARGGVSPRLTQKLTGAAISYADLQLGSEIGKGAYGRVKKRKNHDLFYKIITIARFWKVLMEAGK